MRKKLSLLIVIFAIMSVLGRYDVYASSYNEDSEEVVLYNGNEYNTNKLSQTTLEWLEWYNSLTDAEKITINYVPNELIVQKSRSGICVTDAENIVEGSLHIINNARVLLLQTSGYEPIYNPSYWNSSQNITRANCYAYAMDVICSTSFSLQPGQASGQVYTELSEEALFAAAQNDGPYLGNGRSIRRAHRSEVPGTNEYKIALAIDPERDYHWYVQNRDGYWSHKRGLTEATNLDASGNLISDPLSADRVYGNVNYITFCGYYIVTRQ